MDDLLSRISTVLERQDFRMCVPPESDDTDIVLEECRDAIESLRQQLAAALAACEAKDTIIVKVGEIASPYRDGLKFNYIADLSQEALAIKPDASALKAHDEALIERCAVVCDPKEEFTYSRDYLAGITKCAAAIRELKRTIADGTSD